MDECQKFMLKETRGGEGERKDITLGVLQYDVLTGKENEQTL